MARFVRMTPLLAREEEVEWAERRTEVTFEEGLPTKEVRIQVDLRNILLIYIIDVAWHLQKGMRRVTNIHSSRTYSSVGRHIPFRAATLCGD